MKEIEVIYMHNVDKFPANLLLINFHQFSSTFEIFPSVLLFPNKKSTYKLLYLFNYIIIGLI